MAVYFLREDQRAPGQVEVPYTLLKDGKVIRTGGYSDLYGVVRQQMRPGDTYQETGFDWCSYRQMQDDWAKSDRFDAGDYS